MNKKEFLEKLKFKLEILDEKEIDDILDEYSEHIDEKVKGGVEEKEAISEFGDINELVNGILSAYKINKNFNRKEENSFINEMLESGKEIFDKTIQVVSHGTFKEVIQLLIYICVVLLIVAVLKIPFYFLEDGVNRILYPLPDSVYNIMHTFFVVIIDIAYIIVGLIVFIKILKEKILNVFVVKKEVKEIKTKTKNSKNSDKIIVEKEIKEKIIYRNERTFLDSIGDLFKIFFKVMAAFILMAVVAGLVCSAVLLAFLISFSIKYTLFIGPIISSIGLLVGFVWISELLFRFIFSSKLSFNRLFITFVVSMILCGVGIGISIIEVSKMDFKKYESEVVLLDNFEIEEKNIDKISCWSCDNIQKTINNKLKNSEIIIHAYGEDYMVPYFNTFNDYDEPKTADVSFYTDDLKLYKKVLKDIKKNKFYDYENSSFYIVIEANEKTLESLSYHR